MSNSLTMNAYQAEASSTAQYRWKVIYPALGLANEAGEVLGKIKKLIRDKEITFGEIQDLPGNDRAEIAAEIGDVLWYCAMLAKDLNISLNEVAYMNLDKLASRKARGVIGGSGDDR
jgi:NTP pyrophosphatase (non-canonical NTP hydrolase)|tara:strand:+ start:3935 stop:4285 length:351 start_codon:yes stop_codon:yes gene_type:complete